LTFQNHCPHFWSGGNKTSKEIIVFEKVKEASNSKFKLLLVEVLQLMSTKLTQLD
jgi:hypothetical protein